MTNASAPAWEAKRTHETRRVEELLRQAGFEQVDSYRYNSASIRLRVIDRRFERMSTEQRDALIEPHLEKLPESTQADIVSLFTFAPSELKSASNAVRTRLMNLEFEEPTPSML